MGTIDPFHEYFPLTRDYILTCLKRVIALILLRVDGTPEMGAQSRVYTVRESLEIFSSSYEFVRKYTRFYKDARYKLTNIFIFLNMCPVFQGQLQCYRSQLVSCSA